MSKPKDYHQFLEFFSKKIVNIAVPVILTLLIDAYITRFVEQKSGSAGVDRNFYSTMSYYNAGLSTSDSLLMALIMIVMIIVVTAVLLTLYYFNCMKVIFVWMILAVSLLLSYYMYNAVGKAPEILNIPVDWLTIVIFIANLVIVGNMSIFWRAPPIVTQAFLVLVSILVAIVFLALPDWTIWALLVLLVIYDAVVVLCPNGLLNLLIKKSQERGDAIPALVYSAAAFSLSESELRPEEPTPLETVDAEPEEDNPIITDQQPVTSEGSPAPSKTKRKKKKNRATDSEGIKLGLGDFVFYGILVTRAARLGWDLVILCCFAVILGLSLTLLCLAWLNRPLPALPFSLVLGIIFFIIGSLTFRSFSSALRTSLAVF